MDWRVSFNKPSEGKGSIINISNNNVLCLYVDVIFSDSLLHLIGLEAKIVTQLSEAFSPKGQGKPLPFARMK